MLIMIMTMIMTMIMSIMIMIMIILLSTSRTQSDPRKGAYPKDWLTLCK
jgi:5-bromo-4-chloroindolyl phosphate hydrolysis protein